MIRPLVALALLIAACPPVLAADEIGPWDVKALKAAEVKPEWGKDVGKATEVCYPGEPYKGKPTRVFAYYAKAQTLESGPYPAVLLVHGGGGKAFQAWAEHWAERGYCALAMDLSGNGPSGRLDDGGPDQSDDTKFRDFDDKTVRDMWTYHGIAAIIRGHNLLRSLPEVDKDKIAVTGINQLGRLPDVHHRGGG
jgi:cephalosporin-C deacetylase-like acetyl esterase